MKEMSGINRLLSSGCKLMSLSAVLSFLYLSPTYSADQVIAKGETVDGAVGTKDNVLKISGTSNNAVIEAGTYHEVLSGGFANDTIVNNGFLCILSGGVSKDTTVNGNGRLDVRSGGVADNTTVKKGTIGVDKGGVANNTEIVAGELTIKGEANNIKVSGGTSYISGKVSRSLFNGGNVYISGNATLNHTEVNVRIEAKDKSVFNDLTINKLGTLITQGAVSINDVTVNGGKFSLCAGCSATNLILYDGWYSDIQEGATLNKVTVNEGARLFLDRDGIYKDFVVNKGGKIDVTGFTGKEVSVDGFTINEGGNYAISTNNTILNAFQNGKDVSVVDKVAKGWIINEGDTLKIAADGGIEDVIINTGNIEINKNNTAKRTIVNSSGKITVSAGDVDDLKVNEGGYYDISTSARISNALIHGKEFSLSDNKTIADWEIKNGSSITIDNGGIGKDLYIDVGGGLNVKKGGVAENIVADSLSDIQGASGGLIKNLTVKSNVNKAVDEWKDYFLLTKEDFSDIVNRALSGEEISDEEWNNFELSLNAGRYSFLGLISSSIGSTVDGFKTEFASLDNVVSSNEFARFLRNVMFSSDEGVQYTLIYNYMYDFQQSNSSVNIGSFSSLKNADVENMAIVVDKGSDIRLGKGGYLLTIADSVIDRLALTDGAGFSLTTGDTITNSTQEGKDVSIANGIAKGWTIHDGSSLTVMAGHEADDTVVEKGGELSAAATARLNNMLAAGGAILNLEDGVVLTGDIVVDKDADVSGSTFDFSNIFAASNTDAKSLTVTGGVNEAFTDKLVNEEPNEGKSLTLAGGSYSIADVVKAGSTQVAGWDVINIKATESAPATIVKLESDIGFSGSNKEMIVGEGAVLDVSGHSPLNITIDGNLINNGVIDFTVMDRFGEADDSVTVTGDYIARDGALMVLNIEPENGTADRLIVDGDVKGNTNLYLKTSSDRKADGDILFAEVPNDNPDTASSFEVWRVEGSPYEWSTKFADNKWWTYVSGESNQYVPEVVAYMGLYDAAFEQTRSFVRALSSNSGNNGVLGTRCQYGRCYHLTPAHTAWAVPVYEKAEIQAPYEYDAKITGLDAGIDLAADGVNKVGVTASYRKGRYDFSGYGKDAFAKAGARTDIDSYLLGLYYRRDKDHFRIVTAVYGGIQKADMRSDDGVKAESDAKEYGITLDVAYIYEAVKGITFEPEMQVSWTMLDYDDIKDNVGKTYKMETAQRVEAEVGLKIRKSWEFDAGRAALYIKPSIIRTYHFGGEFALTDERKIKALRDETLGRVEAGAEVVVNARWSVGASVAHTFGSDYKETSANLDLKYRF